jgi:hypothetical protein
MRQAGALVLAAVLCAPGAFVRAEPSAGFKLVVNGTNHTASVGRGEIARLFLRKARNWPSGEPAAPVDQSMQSPVRRSFSRGVLGQSLLAVQSFWHQQIFSGRAVPPPVKMTDEEVCAFVQENQGAVGYVSEEAPLPSGVRVLPLAESPNGRE